MVLVDTSVWIDFFANHPEPHVIALKKMIETGEDLCLCGITLAETLQGIRSERAYRKTKDYFEILIFLEMRKAIYEQAAAMYRSLRKKGVTIRKPVDCLIASVALENDLALLHNDRDFDHISQHFKLQTIRSI
ncbi:MAG: PIN domain nuclease [Candidatus Sumerlaeota bacterium]